MAPKRSAPSSSPVFSSETSSDEEEVGESSSEDEQSQKTRKIAPSFLQLTQTVKAIKEEVMSESESESGTESEDVPIPFSSKPLEVTPIRSVKPRSETSPSTVVPREGTTSNGAFEKSEDRKKHLFQRVWSEGDEVLLLKGMVDFVQTKGVDPTKDMSKYYDFIKQSMHFDVALSQLKDKIWKLKKKFEKHAMKGEKGKTFSKPHDQKLFDLSKKLWGSEGVCGSGRSKGWTPLKMESNVGVEEGEKVEKKEKEKEKEKENHVGSKETPKFDRGVHRLAMEDFVLKRGLDMVEGAKKSEMEEKWRELRVEELELFVKRNELILAQAKLMLAAYKSV